MKNAAAVTLIAVIVFFFIVGPFLTIWSLNTLFGLAIPTTFKTWAATLFLQMVIAARRSSNKE